MAHHERNGGNPYEVRRVAPTTIPSTLFPWSYHVSAIQSPLIDVINPTATLVWLFLKRAISQSLSHPSRPQFLDCRETGAGTPPACASSIGASPDDFASSDGFAFSGFASSAGFAAYPSAGLSSTINPNKLKI